MSDCPPFRYHDRDPRTGVCSNCGEIVPPLPMPPDPTPARTVGENGVGDGSWSLWTDEEAAAIRNALELVPRHENGPDASSGYDCEACPASFGFPPVDGLCPICKGRLSGSITINFYPHHPDDDLPDPTCDVCGAFASISGQNGSWCRDHWPTPGGSDAI